MNEKQIKELTKELTDKYEDYIIFDECDHVWVDSEEIEKIIKNYLNENII